MEGFNLKENCCTKYKAKCKLDRKIEGISKNLKVDKYNPLKIKLMNGIRGYKNLPTHVYLSRGLENQKGSLNESGGTAGCLAPHKAATSVGSLV